MNNILLERGSLLLSGSTPNCGQGQKQLRNVVITPSGGKTERENERDGGNRLGEFYQIICSLHEVQLSHISIMCLFCLAALSLVQTLVAEDVNGREFNFALE